MTQEPTEALKPDLAIPPVTTENLPDKLTDGQIQSFTALANLTTRQQRVLLALIQNISLEIPRTDEAIATELGTSRQFIWQCRQNNKFVRAMGAMLKNLARGTQDKALNILFDRAQTSDKALEMWLRIGETYQPTNRNLNLNASVSGQLDAPQSPKQAIYTMVDRFIGLGYDLPRLLEEITGAFNSLRNEGV